MRRVLPLLGLVLLLGLAFPAAAQSPFRPVETPAEIARLSATPVRATALRPFFFDARLFADAVKDVASERTDEAGTPSTLLELPHPDGGLSLFRVIESPVMAPELAAKFPEIRTFRGEGVDDPTASVRFELSPRGFSAMVLSAFGAWYVEPWSRENRAYVASFHRRDALRDPQSPFACLGPDARDGGEVHVVRSEGPGLGPAPFPLASVGPTLRTYRLALATTGEYSVAVCGANPTKPCVTAELVVAVNRVTGIYEREVAVRMTLVAGNDAVIYLDGSKDPYTNGNASALLIENQSNLDSVIGSANYDVGHVFSTGGGGLAALGVICESGAKAQGETGSSNPTGDAFWVDYVAHEMGHQFGGNHTFNGSASNCGGNRVSSAAYEPGSGSTIMAYAGICSPQDLQPNSDPYFHGKSFDEIVAHITTGGGAACDLSTATSNSAPTVEAGAAYTIPSRTPFALTGSATDPEGDPLTFGWEQFNLGAADSGSTLVDNGSRPIFRSFNATTSPTRTFPKLSDVLAGTPCPGLTPGLMCGETSPTTTRTMTFRLTARDNRGGGGGVNSDTTTVASVSTAGPFVITAPASAVSWPAASTQTVTWNVAGTNLAPISCASVAISLSTDSGASFQTTLLASTPNDGSQAVTLPNTQTSGATARVKVACVGNVFFAISRPSFTISAPLPPPTVSAIDPVSGTTLGGTSVTITGTNLTGATAVTFGGTAATSYTVNSATRITATTPAHAAGAVDVAVTTPSGTATSPIGFAYVVPTPAITAVSPSSGPTDGGTPVTITGSGFVTGATVSIGGVAATSVIVVSATSITAVTGAHAAGPVDVAVTTPGGTATSAGGFTYVLPTPAITAVSPSSGPTDGGTPVTITGSGFIAGATVSIGGVAATSVIVVSATSITAVTGAHAAGPVDVAVTTPGGTATSTGGFTYVLPTPAITAVSPSSGPTAGGTPVTIAGSGFVTGATVSIGGVAATSVIVVSATSITAVTGAHAAGPVDVAVTTPGGTATSTGGFTYVLPTPVITAVSPSSGPTAGGTPVTITGSGFVAGATVSIGGVAATSVIVVSATSITAVTGAHAAGPVDVAVTTPGGTATSTGGFTYVLPTPVITAVSPSSGPTAGGTPVTITGSGFIAGATVSIGGVAATSVIVASATSITAVTGAHAAGPVDVAVTNPGGAPGTLPAGYTYVAGPTGSAFYTVTPCRVVDTRNADGRFGGPVLAASPAERWFALADSCGIPADARVVSTNVTVTGGTVAGSLRIYPTDSTLPVATTISFAAGKTRANNSLLLLSATGDTGRITVRNDSPGPVHLIVDVNGYFR